MHEDSADFCHHVEHANVADIVIGIKDLRVRFPGTVEIVRPEALIVRLLQPERDSNVPLIIVLRGLVSLRVLVDHPWHCDGKTIGFQRFPGKLSASGRGGEGSEDEESNRGLERASGNTRSGKELDRTRQNRLIAGLLLIETHVDRDSVHVIHMIHACVRAARIYMSVSWYRERFSIVEATEFPRQDERIF